jgi:hypothetical protein
MPFDPEELFEAVQADVIAGLGGDAGLDERQLAGTFEVLDDLCTPILLNDDGDAGVVAWRAQSTHNAPFQGLPPTGRRVEITGCTYVVGGNARDATYARFIDWASVLAQMGVTFNTKPLARWRSS